MLTIYHYGNPFRGPAWRWEMAGTILSGEPYVGPDDDPDVQAAVSYRRRLDDRDAPPGDRHELIDAAHRLHVEDGPERWEIEARVLAGEPAEQIAKKTGLSAELVVTYTSIFFAVRDYLQATAWLRWQVLGAPAVNEDGSVPECWAWKYLAFGGEIEVLDIVVGDYLGRPRPAVEDRPTLARVLRLLARLDAVPDHDGETAMAILREVRRLRPGLASGLEEHEEVLATAGSARGGAAASPDAEAASVDSSTTEEAKEMQDAK